MWFFLGVCRHCKGLYVYNQYYCYNNVEVKYCILFSKNFFMDFYYTVGDKLKQLSQYNSNNTKQQYSIHSTFINVNLSYRYKKYSYVSSFFFKLYF